jgi:hypothetical protein
MENSNTGAKTREKRKDPEKREKILRKEKRS